MKTNHVFLKFLLAILFLLELRLLAPISLRATGANVGCIERERQALLQFKAALVDNSGLLSSWGSKERNKDCCEWKGVHCSNQTSHVEMLDLHGDYSWFNRLDGHAWLEGNISASVMELDHLMYLNLSGNYFKGNNILELFGSLSNLRDLDLSSCMFGGNIPIHLGRLPHLRYLDLSYNNLQGSIPYQLGNLSQLQHLDLFANNLQGSIPYQLGNLSQLQYLDLGFNDALKIDQENSAGGVWLSSLTSLTHLDLSEVIILNQSHNWLQSIGKLPKLKELRLHSCGLSDHSIPSLSPSKFNFSTSLAVVDLFANYFMSSMIFHWLMNVSSSLVELDLSLNLLEGPIPSEFGTIMTSLEQIDLSYNKIIHGGIVKSFENICTLRSISLESNHLSDELPTILEILSGCARYSLQELDLSSNQITGKLPNDLSIFASLKTLKLFGNRLNGNIPENLQFPSQLVNLYLGSNSLQGDITDSHFANVSNLKNLDLSYNSLALTFSKNWVPSFQLDTIYLASCKLGPHFPKWLHTQNNYSILDISYARISDIIPKWFWSQLPSKVSHLNISHNNLRASNHFEGKIPPYFHRSFDLDLSNNKFSKSLKFLCANNATKMLEVLDLSNNQLSGELPNCWSCLKSLVYLDLSNNNLSGKVPTSLGSLRELQMLRLRNNSFIGELPFSLKSCSELKWLDVRDNKLSGPIPPWIGNGLQQLQMLSLRNNLFSGSLSMHLCYLTSIHLLDLSLNNISGQILKCFNNLTSMTQENVSTGSNDYYRLNTSDGIMALYRDGIDAMLMWKGVERLFEGAEMPLLKTIDLSSNQLSGEIPREIEDLVQLISLNLSRNNLVGKIPSNIGRLKSLESLDLSRNHLIGSIPSSLAQIDRLAELNLSHNNLHGKIPVGTQLQSFDGSSYEDNPNLCGEPLEKKCSEEETLQPKQEFREEGDSIFCKSFYWSMSTGFITGFCGIFGSILFNRSWRHAYFRFLNNLTDTIYVMATINLAKCRRLLKQ